MKADFQKLKFIRTDLRSLMSQEAMLENIIVDFIIKFFA